MAALKPARESAGYAAGEVAAGAAGAPKGVGYYVLLAVGLLATIAVPILVTRAARRALRRGTGVDGEADEVRSVVPESGGEL